MFLPLPARSVFAALLLAAPLASLDTAAKAASALPPRAPAAVPAPTILVNEDYGDVTDDTDYLWRLGMLEGHLMIGHQLVQAHQQALAMPHFGHPVRELYDDIASYLKAKNVPQFDGQLAALEAAVATQPDSPETEAKYQETIAVIHKAREAAPAELRASLPEMIKVCSNTIDAAAGEYGQSLDNGKIEIIVEYHDSKGYIEYVNQQIQDLQNAHLDAKSQDELNRFKTVLAKANYIVDPLLPGPTPRASVGQYRAVAAEAETAAKQN